MAWPLYSEILLSQLRELVVDDADVLVSLGMTQVGISGITG